MARDSLNAEIARQRQAELRRAVERRSVAAELPARTRIALPPRSRIAGAKASEAVTIRLAAADDGRELDLLARVHGAGAPVGPSLIAELGGRPVAAMSLRDRAVIVDPGERTSDVVELLRLRASQLLEGREPRRVSLGAFARLSRRLVAR